VPEIRVLRKISGPKREREEITSVEMHDEKLQNLSIHLSVTFLYLRFSQISVQIHY
jgi:hypothetical protein